MPTSPSPWFDSVREPKKRPQKKNLLEESIQATGTLELVPVFPYLGNGDIVPCLSVSIGGAGKQPFQFFHHNVVPEVLLCVAGQGSTVQPGQMLQLPPVHGVNPFLKDIADPDAYFVVLVIVRMNEEDDQDEVFVMRCSQCQKVLLEYAGNIKSGRESRYYPEFHAIKLYADGADAFNESHRVCPGCGHENEPLPIEQLGWRRYAEQIRMANAARDQLEKLAQAMNLESES